LEKANEQEIKLDTGKNVEEKAKEKVLLEIFRERRKICFATPFVVVLYFYYISARMGVYSGIFNVYVACVSGLQKGKKSNCFSGKICTQL